MLTSVASVVSATSSCESKVAQSTRVGDRSEIHKAKTTSKRDARKLQVLLFSRDENLESCAESVTCLNPTGSESLHWPSEATGSAMAMAALMTLSRLTADYLELQIHGKGRRRGRLRALHDLDMHILYILFRLLFQMSLLLLNTITILHVFAKRRLLEPACIAPPLETAYPQGRFVPTSALPPGLCTFLVIAA